MNSAASLLLLATLLPAQAPPMRELYQDFRNRQPLSPFLKWVGEPDGIMTPENEGLRLKLPKIETQTWGWGVAANFPLTGDFEITATYEWLNVEPPIKQTPVGVALQVATNAQRTKWARLGRLLRMQENQLSVEVWDNTTTPPRRAVPQPLPTEIRSGQLRLAREGSVLHCSATSGAENKPEDLFDWAFGTDDLDWVRFVAVNNKNPTTVDVRLVDLRIRSASVPASATVASTSTTLPDTPTETAEGRDWTALAGLLGLAFTLALVLAVGLWLDARRGGRAAPRPVDAPVAIAFQCAKCGKGLKAKVELAGKKVKCSQCGQAALVPVKPV